MKRWSLRHTYFKIGFVGIVIFSAIFLIGFSAPAWRNNTGLWVTCLEAMNLCFSHYTTAISHTYKEVPLVNQIWFIMVRSLECISVLNIVLCITTEIYLDFCIGPSADKRFVELFTLLAGVFGIAGVAIFAIFTPVSGSHVYLNWGFTLCAVSSCCFVALASVIAHYRFRGLDSRMYATNPILHYMTAVQSVTPDDCTVNLSPPSYTEAISHLSTPVDHVLIQHGHQDYPASKPQNVDSSPPPPYSLQLSSSQVLDQHSQIPLTDQLAQSSHLSGSKNISDQVCLPDQTGFDSTSLGDANVGSDFQQCNLDDQPGDVISHSLRIPEYFVKICDQAVPVYRDELIQVGGMAPDPVQHTPIYFMVVNEQHIPVYNEEQTLTVDSCR